MKTTKPGDGVTNVPKEYANIKASYVYSGSVCVKLPKELPVTSVAQKIGKSISVVVLSVIVVAKTDGSLLENCQWVGVQAKLVEVLTNEAGLSSRPPTLEVVVRSTFLFAALTISQRSGR